MDNEKAFNNKSHLKKSLMTDTWGGLKHCPTRQSLCSWICEFFSNKSDAMQFLRLPKVISFVAFLKDHYELMNIFQLFQIITLFLWTFLGNWAVVLFLGIGYLFKLVLGYCNTSSVASNGFLILWHVSGSIYIFPAPDMESIISLKKSGFFKYEMNFGYHNLVGYSLVSDWPCF